MLLVLEVGNATTTLGAFRGDELVFTARTATRHTPLPDEHALMLGQLLALYGCAPNSFDGAAISSVVPGLYPALTAAVKQLCGCAAVCVGPGVKTGLDIRLDAPAALGSDRVCGAVAAVSAYPLPALVCNFGTATTICCIGDGGQYLGGCIAPGVEVGAQALADRAAQLPQVALKAPASILGKNTAEAMQAGIVYGAASMVDGMVARYTQLLGQAPTVVATGEFAPLIAPCCRTPLVQDAHLLLRGLRQIYCKNHR